MMKTILVLLLMILSDPAAYANTFEDRLREFSDPIADVAVDLSTSQGIELNSHNFRTQIKDTSDFNYLITLHSACPACYQVSVSILKESNQPINEVTVKNAMNSKSYFRKLANYQFQEK